MRHHLIITLRPTKARPDGAVLTVEYDDRDTAEAVVRSMERYRKHRWGLPDTYLRTVDGQSWCVCSYRDVAWPVVIRPAEQPVLAG